MTVYETFMFVAMVCTCGSHCEVAVYRNIDKDLTPVYQSNLTLVFDRCHVCISKNKWGIWLKLHVGLYGIGSFKH